MLQAAAGHLLIDAAGLSSGGQAIRNAVALSALMTKPVSLVNLRKKKKNSMEERMRSISDLVCDVSCASSLLIRVPASHVLVSH